MSSPVQLTCADCLSPELCAVDGCRKRPPQGLVPAMPPRQPIDLEYRPGRMVRALMAITDRGEAMVRRGPAPFAPEPEEPPPVSDAPAAPPPPPETVRQVLASANLAPAPPAPRPPPPSTRAVSEIRARRVGRGWLVYADGAEVDVTSDVEIGAVIGGLAAR